MSHLDRSRTSKVVDRPTRIGRSTETEQTSMGTSFSPGRPQARTTNARWHKLLLTLVLLFLAAPLVAETFYVRPDGGTRYSAKDNAGDCDGKADLAYPGKGVNRHCAFGDYRYLWDDRHSYGTFKWAIAGGDTVIIRGGPWRVGFDQGKSANDAWCFGGGGAYGCTNTPIPAGTPAHHTRILGEHFGDCIAPSRKTQIFGGFGVNAALNLSDAQYVDVECLEITRHSQCIVHGSPPYPNSCNRSGPIDDYDSDGVTTNVNTHDVLLQDLWVHGHTDRGILGPIGGVVTANRVDIAYNGMAGWDFDDGGGTPSVHATLNFNNSIIEWNGCNQEYPIKHAFPAISCYGQSSGGYGDGIGTPTGMGLDVFIDHSIFRYNTQDGEDFGHVDTGSHTLHITNSYSYGNGGGQFKWGANFTTVVFENNLVLGNCARMSAPFAGAPETYNAHLQDFCRADDAVSFNFKQGGTALFSNNTFVSYSPTTFDVGCWEEKCSNSTLIFENNIVLGYDNPKTYSLGGKEGGPGGFYYDKPIGKIVRTNNLYFGLRNFRCFMSGLAKEQCTDPKFASQPIFKKEADLDGFNFHLSPSSPARHVGIGVPGLTLDYDGKSLPTTGSPDLGALQQ